MFFPFMATGMPSGHVLVFKCVLSLPVKLVVIWDNLEIPSLRSAVSL